MGLLRVFLAMVVLVAHAGGFGGYSPLNGPLAVQAFFIISGFYMGLVLNERYDRPETNGIFWLNRGLRIYTSYYVILLLYLAIYAVGSLAGQGSPLDIYASDGLPLSEKLALGLLNLTVIGQELPDFLGIAGGHLAWQAHIAGPDGTAGAYLVIPPAWSLSLELCFYALAPFLVRRSAASIAAMIAASLLLRLVATSIWQIDEAPFSKGFLPFELALFLAGSLAYKAWAAAPERFETPPWRALVLLVPLAACAYPWLAGTTSPFRFFAPERLAFLALVCLALPAVHGWSRHSRIDRSIGELSYPVYLVHGLVMPLIPGAQGDPVRTVLIMAASAAAGWVVVRTVEARIAGLRQRVRARARRPGREQGGRRTGAGTGRVPAHGFDHGAPIDYRRGSHARSPDQIGEQASLALTRH